MASSWQTRHPIWVYVDSVNKILDGSGFMSAPFYPACYEELGWGSGGCGNRDLPTVS